jgi:hypothetical protein
VTLALRTDERLDPAIAALKFPGASGSFGGRTVANDKELEVADCLTQHRVDGKWQEHRRAMDGQKDREQHGRSPVRHLQVA